MEAYRSAADIAARKRQVSVTPIAGSNVVTIRFGQPSITKTDFGAGWYHAAAIQDEQSRPPKA